MQKSFSSKPDTVADKNASTDATNRKEETSPVNNASKAKFNGLMKAAPKDQTQKPGSTSVSDNNKTSTTTGNAKSSFTPDFTYARDLMMSRVSPDQVVSASSADSNSENQLNGQRDRQTNSPDVLPASSQMLQNTYSGASTHAPAEAEAHTPQSDELSQLLQKLCSDVYVSSGDVAGKSRMYMALDSALPGAAVEFVRDGAFMYVRLHATNETAFRTMSLQRDALQDVLKKSTNLNVSVEVIQRDGQSDSDNA